VLGLIVERTIWVSDLPLVTIPKRPVAGSQLKVHVAGDPPLTIEVFLGEEPLGRWRSEDQRTCTASLRLPADSAGREIRVVVSDQQVTSTRRVAVG
jgi:hypothetical protein